MKKQTINLWNKEDYSYPCAGEFLPNITAYLHKDEEVRPAMLVDQKSSRLNASHSDR